MFLEKKGISKCDYNKVKTTIYINEDNNKCDANSIMVAAHEASHALNYSEGITNNRLLKSLERLWWLFASLLLLVIFVDLITHMVSDYTIPKIMF